MKYGNDHRQLDLVSSANRQPGRPPTGVAKTAAERQAARRERLAKKGKGVLTVDVSQEVIEALDKYVQFKDVTKGDVVDRLLRGALLRKR
ncbi:hypothetical protein GJ698_14395 [Pseudoduganella sp. FT26W]|uniref:Uncharacterized protein n=1 Tax=Duganella aquatilis TaxID=2666082 RepID=A0A844D2V0_9BURK|nr:hypothetical protein [Duganella aquatilis]MRW85271.1 hypothetical protein [Duganella aquatilis]